MKSFAKALITASVKGSANSAATTFMSVSYTHLDVYKRQELYSDGFKLCLGGGVPGTMVNIGRLNIPVRTATWLGLDMF